MIDNIPPFILASKSPRRKELLEQCGFKFEIYVSDISEDIKENESPEDLVVRLSFEKAKAVSSNYPEKWILGADTVVVIDHKILGKPNSKEEAIEMLSLLQGRDHKVFSGITLYCGKLDRRISESYETIVSMRKLSKEDIYSYVETGEPMDKAGSYAIQGVGSLLIDKVNGSYTNVVGLNVAGVKDLFSKIL